RGTGRGGPLLHTPTANLQTESRLIPKEGVYAARVTIDPASGMPLGKTGRMTFDAVANIGSNPTFGEGKMAYEVHLLNFNADLTGHLLRLHFITRIRDEKKFKGPEELSVQIQKDIAKAGTLLKKMQPALYF
ncbi:MAG: riboflavin kinase, partial [Nitrospiraceae bacterium]|nr:riboflavin kinase [Nitrospiraceae bacterium]